MRPIRLLWQLYPSYLLIILLALLAAGVLAYRSEESFYLELFREELRGRSEIVAQELVAIRPGASADDRRSRAGDLAQRIHKTTNTRVTVIEPNGHVVLDTDEDPARMANHGDRPEVQAALAGRIGEDSRFSATIKQRMMYLAVPVRETGGMITAVVRSAVPLTAVDQVTRTARYALLGSGILVAAIAAVVCFFVSRRIVRPLEEMRQGAERFAHGELGYKLSIPASEELAGLARALNRMAEQMQERIDTILQQTSQQDAVLGSMGEGVLAVDPQQRIISLNPAGSQLLGCSRHAALGRSAAQVIVHPELRQFVAQALACHEPIEQDVVLHTGSERIIHLRGTALGRGEGSARGAVIVMNDISNVRRLETLRRDFVANVSHELKTPITSIKGFVETLLDGALDNRDDTERFLDIVNKQADRLGAIVDDLLSLAKIEQSEESASLDLHEAGVRTVLEAAIHNCDGLARERSVRVSLEMAEADVWAQINPPLLEQAVTNLLDNAIKYSPPDRNVVVAAAGRDGEVAISVKDEGVGIEAEHVPRLFERFYRVDKARSRKLGGTGLGLAIVKHIVSAHRGRVEVQSTPGVGSTFTIHLPQPEATVPASSRTRALAV
jgi:two-component system phosphate regulon sensor histidine kinase PhoR